MCANWNTVCVHEVVIMSELRLNVRGSEGCILYVFGVRIRILSLTPF